MSNEKVELYMSNKIQVWIEDDINFSHVIFSWSVDKDFFNRLSYSNFCELTRFFIKII